MINAMRSFLTIILLVVASGKATALTELLCTLKTPSAFSDTTIACYSDIGCKAAAALGGEPIRDFDQKSAPYALARGKISAIISSSIALISEAKKNNAECMPLPASSETTSSGPAFDCQKAEHEAEQLICKDGELSALDRKLDKTFQSAKGNLSNEQISQLAAEQRGWVKGRNDCWKENDKKACIAAEYRKRNVVLSARYGLAKVGTSIYFGCDDGIRDDLIFTPVETDPPSANLVRGEETTTVILTPSGSGAHYEGDFGISFWNRGNDAQVKWPQDKSYACKVKQTGTGE